MKIVLDSNIYIAAFLAKGNCHEVYESAIKKNSIHISSYILKELQKNLSNKKKSGLTPNDVKDILFQIAEKTTRQKKVPLLDIPECPDPKDIPILSLARAVDADALITGDKALRKMNWFENTIIITPAEYWKYEAMHTLNIPNSAYRE